MTPELWNRLNPLFDAALEKPLPERKAFAAAVCGDDLELRRELLALVDGHALETAVSKDIGAGIKALIHSALPSDPAPGDLLLQRFQILDSLGSGGMGKVYKALDTELGQTVALKMIRPEIARNEAILLRFKREVQLARRLSGPNLCRIHELFLLKDKDGLTTGAFLTMEFLAGMTLADKLQEGPLPWREAQAIATDICAGLAAMHQAGILHRDVKSRNIMLADRDGSRRAVLMDFGLARELSDPSPAGETGLTVPGAVIGTPDYMAPEQFEGKAATPATDIYAVGIVLYELLTGRHPFASASPLGAAVSRGRRLLPASSVSHGLPHRWDAVIRRCLEFDASRRYQSADELARALTRSFPAINIRPPSPAVLLPWVLGMAAVLACAWFIPPLRERVEGVAFADREKHIAVLPFDVSGSSQEVVVLADGLMESLTGKLSNLDPENKALWVVPASEIRRRKVGDPAAAYHEFGATMVVKGRFSRDAGGVHLKLELIDPRKMREIGYADIDDAGQDLSALQSEAAASLGRLMNLYATKAPGRAGDEGVSSAAYQDYIAALGYLQRYDKPGYLDSAISSLTQAVAASPGFALAFVELGKAYTLKYQTDANPSALDKARQFCTQAISLDNRIPAAYAALATLDLIAGNNDLATQEFQHVTDLDPKNVEALTGLAYIYEKQTNDAKAESAFIKAVQLRPGDWSGYNNLGNFYDRIGRHRDAIAQLQHALQLTPDNGYLVSNLAGAYLNSGEVALLPDAESAFKRSIALVPTYQAYAGLGYLYGLERRFTEAAAATEKALQLDDQDFQVWTNLSQVYEGAGDKAKAAIAGKRAIELAERALRLNSQNAEAHAELAELEARNNRRDAALGHIHSALAMAPTDESVLSEVADASEILGDRAHAIEYLESALKNGFTPLQMNGDIVLKRVSADPRFRPRLK